MSERRETGTFSCPWCQAEMENIGLFELHVKAQHRGEKVSVDKLKELSDWKAGKINVIDI